MFGQLQSQSSGYGEKEISDIDLENIIWSCPPVKRS
jgi:hypothetical protein